MHNFFTPIEVKRPVSNAYPPQALKRFTNQLYAITQPRVLSLADERKKIVSWFRSLPLIQRRQVSTFYSPQLCALLGRLWTERQQSIQSFKYRFALKQEKYYVIKERSYRNYSQKQKELLEQIVMVSKSRLYEGITLADSLLRQPENLFQLLDQLQGGVVEYLGDMEHKEMQKQIYFEDEAQGEAKLLGVWVGSFIMKQISLFYIRGTAQLQKICEHHRCQQRDYANLWQNLSQQEKEKLLNSILSKSAKQILSNYRETLQVEQDWLPIVYRQQSQNYIIQRWVNCLPKELINQITYTPLSRAYELYNMYRMEMVLEIESILAQKYKNGGKSKKNKAKKKKKKEQNQVKQEMIAVQETLPVKKTIIKAKTFDEQIKERQFKFEAIKEVKSDILSEETNITQEEKTQIIQAQYKYDKKQKVQDPKIDRKEKQQLIILQKPKQDKKYSLKLEQLYKKIKQDNRDKCRKIIFNRLIHILSQFGIIVRAYGSFASQLSLPDSDLDVSVDSSVLSFFSLQYLNHRNQVIFALQYISNILKRFAWIKDFQLLDKAKVPLLTFSADASQFYQLGPDEKTKFKVNNKKIDPEKGVVQVDITVQPFANTPQLPHCGLQSTQSLKGWMNFYPSLQKTIIILKLLLRKTQLNKTYDGGIGSYALSLLVIAYYRDQAVPPVDLELILKGFSIFLTKFYEHKWLIDPQGELPVIKEEHWNGPILKHPFDGHNILEKSTRFAMVVEVIATWQSLLEQPS